MAQQVFKPKSPEQLAAEKEAAKETLISTYLMYEDGIPEAMKVRNENPDKYPKNANDETKELMETMQADVIDRFLALGYTKQEFDEALAARKAKMGKKKGNNRKVLEEIIKKETEKDEMREYIASLKKDIPDFTQEKKQEEKSVDNKANIVQPTENQYFTEVKPIEKEVKIPTEKDYSANKVGVGNNIQYDLVPLPSHGECYKSKLEKVPVGYLTAYDENLIVSPNLYKDGTFLDEILRKKIMNSKINADELLPGDRDAIILWLRGTSYGTDFPVTVTDAESGKQFESIVDLTTIKPKEFNLKGDEDGYFDFTLPVSQDKIKFRFLSYKNLKALEKLEEEESLSIRKQRLTELTEEIGQLINSDAECEKTLKKKLTDSVKNIETYTENIDAEEGEKFTHSVTNKLAMSIMEVNGVNDRSYINQYVLNMNVRDSSALRRYITENEPGLDFNVEIERPESLGGGSVRMFLTLDQYIFLNLA